MNIISAILIVGGRKSPEDAGALSSVEEFNTVTSHSHSVGTLPEANFEGSFCNNLYCGGNPNSRKSCVRFQGNGTFSQVPVLLVEERAAHLCWGLPTGDVILFGGRYSKRTTERVSSTGLSSSPDFNLPYDTK